MTDEPLIPEVLDPLPTLTPRQLEVIEWRAQGLGYREIEAEHGVTVSTAHRWMQRPGAREKLGQLRLSAIEMLDEVSPQFVRALSTIAEDHTAEPKDRVSAAKGGLQALAALKRADAASRVADVEEKRSLSPDEMTTRRAELLDRVGRRLRLVGGGS